jgi:hypothetical protein
MHFANLVIDTGVEQDALSYRCLAGVNVRANTNIAVAINGGFACHSIQPSLIKNNRR